MKIVAIKALRDFWDRHPAAAQPLKAWVDAKAQKPQKPGSGLALRHFYLTKQTPLPRI
jgi:mRNA interferase HigB